MRVIDPDSSTPLYLQIADAIRGRIEAGRLSPGESLAPLREAADRWGVSLHTVRHAYTSLARDGLLEVRRGPGGTRVRPDAGAGKISGEGAERADGGFDAFLCQTLRRADAEFGMSPAALVAALGRRAADGTAEDRPRAWVVECSRWQCEAHAREIQELYAVDARPWVLGEREGPPPGPIVATYFHFNELRRSWPRRFAAISFVEIRVDARLREVLRNEGAQFVVCERDEPTARAVVADLMALTPEADPPLGIAVSGDPAAVIRDAEPTARVLCPPRVWATLEEDERSDPRAVEIRYLFDRDRLSEVARHQGWPARAARMAGARSAANSSARLPPLRTEESA